MEAFEVNAAPLGDIPDRSEISGFRISNVSGTTLDNPLHSPGILREPGPQEGTVGIATEPVDKEDTRIQNL
jgi:hypothetical protein